MKITKEKIMRQLSAIAFSDLSRFVGVETDENGAQCLTVRSTAELSPTQRLALCSLKAGTRGIEVKLYDKLKALEMLARLTGIFSSSEDETDALREIFAGFGADICAEDENAE